MVGGVILLTLLPALVACSGDGNIRLLEEEVAVALKTCSNPYDNNIPKNVSSNRQRRSESYPRIDNNTKQEINQYGHERRNSSNLREEIQPINGTDYDYGSISTGNRELTSSVPKSASSDSYIVNATQYLNRTKRSEPLLNKPDSDQCLSQCVFANLQVVDSRGIPREAELWDIVQSSVSSQQSRAALRDQIRACFQELQTEAEDNGCSYSNKLERCLMLRFSDRKMNSQGTNKKS